MLKKNCLLGHWPQLVLAAALLTLFIAPVATAAPLTDFHNNFIQIDAGFEPSDVRTTTLANELSYQDNTSAYSADITVVLSSNIALRLGGTSASQQSMSWSNTDFAQLGMTQTNLQVIFNVNDFIQPFLGVQYATANLQTWNSTWNTQAAGICGGLQLTVPIMGLFALNASGMLGSYANTGYAGLAICLGSQLDVDAGFAYEQYLVGNIPDSGYGISKVSTQGPRVGVSLRL